MDFLQIKYFCKVVETENMTQAAKQLFVPQPTISASLSRLEQELGTQLFDRYNNRIVLNEAGRAFYKRSLELLRLQEDIKNQISDIAGSPPMVISVAASIQEISSEIIAGFLRENPDFQFVQHQQDPKSVLKLLEYGEAVLAITHEPEKKSSQYCFEPLCREEVCVGMSREHPLANEKTLTMQQLAEETFIVSRPSYGEAGEFESHFSDIETEPKISIVANEKRLIISAVALGRGITLMSSMGLDPDNVLNSMGFVAIPLISKRPKRWIGLLWMKSHYFTRPQQMFKDYCKSYLEEVERKNSPD